MVAPWRPDSREEKEESSMNDLTIPELRHALNHPGDWSELHTLAKELFRRLDIAQAQVAAWQRHDSDSSGSYCPTRSADGPPDYDPGPSRGNGGFDCDR